MKQYDFDTLHERVGTGSIKWEKEFESDASKRFPLWVADMDFPCSDAIIEALHKRVDERMYGYHTGLDNEYKDAVIGWFKKRFDWHVHEDSIFYAGGVVPALAWLLEILSEEGDGIVIQTPVYYPFRKKIEATKRKVIENPLFNDYGYYTMNYIQLEEQMKRRDVKGLILCSPHNPVGRVWREEELRQVADIAKRYDKWIISDEIHGDIIRSSQHHIPLAKLAEDAADRIITCTAPSKTFNLAGLQNSNIIIDNPAYRSLWKAFVWDRLSLNSPNSFALRATIAAYTASDDWLKQVNDYIDENMRQAKAYIEKHLPKAIVSDPQGTYLLWVDVRSYCDDKDRLEACMLKHGLLFDEGYLFGKEGAGFERINVACPRAFLMECLEVFVKALETMNHIRIK